MIFTRDFLNDAIIQTAADTLAAPVVSVILPTYKRCQNGMLERSIRSVLAQHFTDFELIIMDDGSTDGSDKLIERFGRSDPRLVHVRHDVNSGLPGLRVNEGIGLARGQYLAFQFDDDLWRPNALEDLVSEARRHSEPVVVVGQAQITSRVGKGILPSKAVDMVLLTEMNRIANNSVLLPRTLLDVYGMYDPHIGMRRLTDWDLWLRLIEQVPFITLETVVSEVYESNVGAIGVTVPWDLALFRYLHSIPRNALLRPSVWRDYPVDSLTIGEVEIPGEFRRRLYEEQIVPFYFKQRHRFPALGSFLAAPLTTATPTAEKPPQALRTVLYTKSDYDVSNAVTIGHYDELTNRRGSFKSYYQPLDELNSRQAFEADTLLVMRSVETQALEVAERAIKTRRAVGLYLDDDLFTFHEYGPAYNYLAPGTPYHQNLRSLAARADAVLTTTAAIERSVRAVNPRTIPHNNTIPDACLPDRLRPRNQPIRIGYAGSGYRIEEFRELWPALVRLAEEYGSQLEFEFWGLDVSSLPELASPVNQRPFTFSYGRYIKALQASRLDILITPLLDRPAPRLAKSLIKYYETAAAGALGIFSDVPQYAALPGGQTCLKAANDPQSWYEALKAAIEMPAVDFDRMRSRCIEHVREEYSASAQIDLHEAALRALEFHARTRSQRQANGRPQVMYVLHSAHFGGAEIQLWRRLRLISRYGIQPVVVIPGVLSDTEDGRRLRQQLAREGIPLESVEYTCFTEPRSPAEFFSDLERSQIQALLERVRPALVHTVTFIPSFGQICRELNIPHIATLYAVQDRFAWQNGTPGFTHCSLVQSDCLRYASRWGRLLETSHFVSRDMAPEDLFRLGQCRRRQAADAPPPALHRPTLVATGTFQERKQQLETILAAGQLKEEGFQFELRFYGYTHFFPDYLKQCRDAIRDCGLEDRVTINEFTDDLEQVLGQADALLSLSTYESFPGSIKDALAAGTPVVATPVGGVTELITDEVSGIVCAGTQVPDLVDGIRRMLLLTPDRRAAIAETGRRIARLELHPQRTANDLFRMYNLALHAAAAATRPAPGEMSRFVAERWADDHRTATVEDSSGRRLQMRAPAGPFSSLFPLGPGAIYRLRPDQPDWCGIDIELQPFVKGVSGRVDIIVRTLVGEELRKASCLLKNFREIGWVELRFPAIHNTLGMEFQVEISFSGADSGFLRSTPPLSLHQITPPPPRVVRMINRGLRLAGIRLRGGELYCRMWYL